ncbi:unannotated protein [freshwater metagenome]|uniref:Unannotated protein n=1 Tax=freshwater metagenome TaxID=449393 RepID=A0A6J7JBM3_9ZZZZ|nr:hypothetical protein [Actinomycetota bacterium]
MSVRRLLAGVATTSLLATALAVAAPAQADPTFVPDADDIVGAGSDTSMYALTYLADGNAGVAGYNAGGAAQRLVSFDANIFNAAGAQTNSATVVLRDGTAPITRPNGSGAGKNLLYGAGNNPNVSFARSSSGNNANETAANLQAFPFAKDTLAMATASTSNAPASLTPAQIVSIYKGEVTNWSQLGGAAGVIKPLIPQTGSGTRSFFVSELKSMNGGVDVALAGTVTPVQEHDDSAIKADPNAVAPFSVGRAGLLGTLRIEQGWSAARALYNVVRPGDAASAWAQGIFGPTGFVCSPAATSLILDAGFEQLLSTAQGGKCGVATNTATAASDLLTAKVSTTTTVSGVSTSAGALSLTATVGGGGTLKPQGVVAFSIDGVVKGNGVVTGGRATFSTTGLTPGVHKVKATFTPTGAAFNASSSAEVDVTVRSADAVPAPTPAATKLSHTFKKSYAKGASIKGKVKVKESAAGTASGKVVVKLGKKTVGKGTVKGGTATIKLTKPLKKGKNKLVASYAGNASFAASKVKFVITIK